MFKLILTKFQFVVRSSVILCVLAKANKIEWTCLHSHTTFGNNFPTSRYFLFKKINFKQKTAIWMQQWVFTRHRKLHTTHIHDYGNFHTDRMNEPHTQICADDRVHLMGMKVHRGKRPGMKMNGYENVRIPLNHSPMNYATHIQTKFSVLPTDQ